jgi:hypothetical protein
MKMSNQTFNPYNVTDIIYQDNVIYISNGLHDYMINNFFVAFAMGVLFGVIIGLNAYLFTAFIKTHLKIEE